MWILSKANFKISQGSGSEYFVIVVDVEASNWRASHKRGFMGWRHTILLDYLFGS